MLLSPTGCIAHMAQTPNAPSPLPPRLPTPSLVPSTSPTGNCCHPCPLYGIALTPSALSTLPHTQLGAYQPHWQLLPPCQPLPPSLCSMYRLLAHPDMYRLVWYCLSARTAANSGRTAREPLVSEDMGMSALNLLSLQLHHLKEEVEGGRRSAEEEEEGGRTAEAVEGRSLVVALGPADQQAALGSASIRAAAAAALWGGEAEGYCYDRGSGRSSVKQV